MANILVLLMFAMPSYGSTTNPSPTFDVCSKTERLACRKMLKTDWKKETHLEIDIYQIESTQGVGILFKMGNEPSRVETVCLGSPVKMAEKDELLSFQADFHCLDETGGPNEFLFDRKAMTMTTPVEGSEPYACQCENF